MNHRYTVETLRELIAVRREDAANLKACAQHTPAEQLKAMFTLQAGECAQAVEELQCLVSQLDDAPGENPPARARIFHHGRHGWADLSAALARNEDGAILEECERGASRALELYRNALDDPLPDFVRGVVLRQFEALMSHYVTHRLTHQSTRHPPH